MGALVVRILGATGTYSDVSWWQAHPADPTSYVPVSKNRPVLLFGMWIEGRYGYVVNAPNIVLFTVDVTGPEGFSQHFSPQQAKACWTGPYVWDGFWSAFFNDAWATDIVFVPFNPRIGAGVYGNNLQLPLGPFVTSGTYHVEVTWVQARPSNEMLDFGDPALPRHYSAGTQGETYGFDMEVN